MILGKRSFVDLMRFTGFYRVLLGFTEFHQVLPSYRISTSLALVEHWKDTVNWTWDWKAEKIPEKILEKILGSKNNLD